MYEIDVQNEGRYAVDSERLRAAAEKVLMRHQTAAGSGMTIVITGDEKITAMNLRYRGIDAPTDVLSFPADALPDEFADEAPYLGDLVIAYPYASAQATREGHNLQDSVCLLVVHGTLHLLGYDHDTPARRAEMWSAQAELLTALGISPDIVPALEGDHDGGHEA